MIGGLSLMVPAGLGAIFALDPLVRKKPSESAGEYLKVAPLMAVVPGAPPRAFPVIANQSDAWSQESGAEIGSVLLFREPGTHDDDPAVMAWSTVCPHLGCRIDWAPDRDSFFCPCHSSVWDAAGKRGNNVSPRDMDRLETEIRKSPQGPEVWVAFRKFKTGIAEQQVV